MDGRLWPLRMWSCVPVGFIVATTSMASLSVAGGNAAPRGKYSPSGTSADHPGLCPLGAAKGSSVVVHCDNMGAVTVVNMGSSKVQQIMHLLRCLFFIRAHFNLSVAAVHVPGVENGWADAISRNMLSDFLAQVTQAIGKRLHIPPSLLDLLVVRQPDWTSAAWTQLFKHCFLPA